MENLEGKTVKLLRDHPDNHFYTKVFSKGQYGVVTYVPKGSLLPIHVKIGTEIALFNEFEIEVLDMSLKKGDIVKVISCPPPNDNEWVQIGDIGIIKHIYIKIINILFQLILKMVSMNYSKKRS